MSNEHSIHKLYFYTLLVISRVGTVNCGWAVSY